MSALPKLSPRRFILTGTPGSGKTAILRGLEERGHCVVEEAATDVIALEQARGAAEPWRDASFIDKIVALQRRRQQRADGAVQFHDRSPVCAYALSLYLRYPASPALSAELERIASDKIYEPRVFFIRNLGFIEKTAARRIDLVAALEFEALHERVYREMGYELTLIAPAPLDVRVGQIERLAAR
jgi:predicted ATPase